MNVTFSHAHYRALGPELIPVYRQSSRRWLLVLPGSRLPLLSARPAIIFPAEERHRLSTSTKLYCLVTEAHRLRVSKIVKRIVNYIIFTLHARNVRLQRVLRSQMSTNWDDAWKRVNSLNHAVHWTYGSRRGASVYTCLRSFWRQKFRANDVLGLLQIWRFLRQY